MGRLYIRSFDLDPLGLKQMYKIQIYLQQVNLNSVSPNITVVQLLLFVK